jgi:hypothetical protein
VPDAGHRPRLAQPATAGGGAFAEARGGGEDLEHNGAAQAAGPDGQVDHAHGAAAQLVLDREARDAREPLRAGQDEPEVGAPAREPFHDRLARRATLDVLLDGSEGRLVERVGAEQPQVLLARAAQ